MVDGVVHKGLDSSVVREANGALAYFSSAKSTIPASIVSGNRRLVPVGRRLYPGAYLDVHARQVSASAMVTGDTGVNVDLSDDMKNTPSRPVMNVSLSSVNRLPSRCASEGVHYVETAVAYDTTFCDMHDSEMDASVAIQSLVDTASTAYEKTTCIKLVLTRIEAHCNEATDPYRSLRGLVGGDIFSGFVSYWRTNRQSVRRDISHFVSGFKDTSSTAGIAYVAAACNNLYNFGWDELDDTRVFAHEVGHNMGANHDSSGLMYPSLSSSTTLDFSTTSSNVMDNFANSKTCLNDEPLSDLNTCPARCVNKKCITDGPVTPTNPPPTSLPTNPPTDGSCGSNFLPKRPYTCKSKNFNFNFGKRGSSTGRIAIEYNKIALSFTAGSNTVFKKAGFAFNLGSPPAAPAAVSLPSDQTTLLSEKSLNGFTIPSELTSCCKQRIFYSFAIQACKISTGKCKLKSKSRSYKLKCQKVCKNIPGGVPSPMTGTKQCQTCDV